MYVVSSTCFANLHPNPKQNNHLQHYVTLDVHNLKYLERKILLLNLRQLCCCCSQTVSSDQTGMLRLICEQTPRDNQGLGSLPAPKVGPTYIS